MSEWTGEKINDALNKLEKRSKNDLEFRELAIKEPNKAIKEITGESLPIGVEINFVENKKYKRTIILPEFEGDELTDDDLEHVAGGRADCKTKSKCNVYNCNHY